MRSKLFEHTHTLFFVKFFFESIDLSLNNTWSVATTLYSNISRNKNQLNAVTNAIKRTERNKNHWNRYKSNKAQYPLRDCFCQKYIVNHLKQMFVMGLKRTEQNNKKKDETSTNLVRSAFVMMETAKNRKLQKQR